MIKIDDPAVCAAMSAYFSRGDMLPGDERAICKDLVLASLQAEYLLRKARRIIRGDRDPSETVAARLTRTGELLVLIGKWLHDDEPSAARKKL